MKNKSCYIIYKIDKEKNDISFIKEYKSIKEIEKDYNIKNGYHYIIKSLDKLTDKMHLLNNNYVIFKDIL